MLPYVAVSVLIGLLSLQTASAAIYKRSGAQSANALGTEPVSEPAAAVQFNPAAAAEENTDLTDKLTWKCANNASCLYDVANGIMQSYRRGETIKLGLFDLIKLPALPPNEARASKSKWGTGRGISTLMDFVSGNAIRVPVGPMVFSVQRAEDDSDYIEVALLKKATTATGRLQGNGGGRLGGGGGGGGLLSGGGGGGGLLGGGGGHGGLRKNKEDKKQFQMYIPMYLAATTFGWTMVAAKAVGLLTLKALLLSKIAFVVAAIVLIKKLMDNASEKMMYQFPEHTPYMMPYGLDYPMHGAELAPAEMYPATLHHLAAAGGGQLPHTGHPALESFAAESHLHPHVAASDVNNTQVLAAFSGLGGLGQKVKPTPARRPLIYNYVQSHMPYYRT